MAATVIKNVRVILEDRVINGGAAVENGIISRIFEGNPDFSAEIVIDGGGLYLSPGFIDTHCHGASGCDYMDGTVMAMETAARTQLAFGATSVVPTALSGTTEQILKFIKNFQVLKSNMRNGPRMPGVHLEGPYFSAAQCGAQDPELIRAPRPEEYKKIIDEAHGEICLWSAAPELEGAMEFGRYCARNHIICSAGHSDAQWSHMETAWMNGFSRVTHLYSACSTVRRIGGYRYLGVVESAFLLKNMIVEIIADGCHIPPELIRMVYENKGADRIVLVTDSMRAAGTDAKTSVLGSLSEGQEVIIEDGVAKMADRKAFAGSVATCDRLVRTARKCGIPLCEAVKMASLTPAYSIGISSATGSIAVGKYADLILFDDEIHVKWCMVGGKTIRH